MEIQFAYFEVNFKIDRPNLSFTYSSIIDSSIFESDAEVAQYKYKVVSFTWLNDVTFESNLYVVLFMRVILDLRAIYYW